MIDQFESIISERQMVLDKDQQRFHYLGYIKLAFVILFGFVSYKIYINWEIAVWKALWAGLLVVQVVLWSKHSRLGNDISHTRAIIEINQRHILRATGEWTDFPDTGEEYVDRAHPYCSDLDIVGKKSLFQFLNTTHSWYGRQTFAHDLLHADYCKEEIAERQKACRELSQNSQLSDELEYCFSRIGVDAATPGLLSELENRRPFLKNIALRMVLFYAPLILIGLTGLSVIFQWRQFYFPLTVLYAIQAIAWGVTIPATSRYLKSIQQLPYKLSAYSDVIDLLSRVDFTSQVLQQIQAELVSSEVSAVQAMKELSRISDRASVCGNPIIYFLLNVLLLWDFETACLFSDWKGKYAPHCGRWFASLGTLESLGCFATLLKVCDHTCFPTLTENREANALELGHPLLPGKERVTNSLNLKNSIIIISGSNMSGKTTYLRTVGVNIVLARAGAPVCARSMECSMMLPYTSMRIADDLNEGISTFYAELKRIKGILDAARSDRSTLFLIDEIFRGTNSVDRLLGAKTVITKLNQLGSVGMITTHDLELCDLERENSRITNYSFAEQYQNGQIHFDYKMQPGKSKTTNAQYLMELIGIL